jgi:hypothetical protein
VATDNTLTNLAIGVSGAVALIVAAIAAVTAHYRQRAALNAEAKRLDKQLAHDRLLRDIEDIRARLDDTIDMAEAALSAVHEAHVKLDAGDRQACDDQLKQAGECLGQYDYKERRVRLRIGQAHPLIGRLSEYRLAVRGLYELTVAAAGQGNAVPADAWDAGMAGIDDAQTAVIEAAQESIGARLSPEGS